MEYYILQCYQKKKKECPEIEPRGNKCGIKTKVGIGICVIVIVVAGVVAIENMIRLPLCSIISSVFWGASILGIIIIDKKE